MSRKGFTLMELLAVIVILGIVFVIALPTISNVITNTKEKVYISNEQMLTNAAKNHLYSEHSTFSEQIGQTITIKLSELQEKDILNTIIDPNDSDIECNGYVKVENIDGNKYNYNSYLKCGDNYITEGYVDDSLYPTEDLVLHLDASTITGLNDGDKVSQWDDISGSGNHLTQSDSNSQPIYKATIWNSKPAIQSSAARADRLVNNNIQTNINKTTGVTIFIVMNIPNIQNGGIYELSTDINTVNDGISLIPWGATLYSRGPMGTTDIVYGFTLNTPLIITQRFAPDTGPNAEATDRHKLWENGIFKGSVNPAWDNRYYNTLSLITLTGNGQYTRDSLIAEFMIYSRALSDSERQKVEQYLSTKWLY